MILSLNISAIRSAMITSTSRQLYFNNMLYTLSVTKILLFVSQFAKDNDIYFEFHACHCVVRNSCFFKEENVLVFTTLIYQNVLVLSHLLLSLLSLIVFLIKSMCSIVSSTPIAFYNCVSSSTCVLNMNKLNCSSYVVDRSDDNEFEPSNITKCVSHISSPYPLTDLHFE